MKSLINKIKTELSGEEGAMAVILGILVILMTSGLINMMVHNQ